MAWRLKPGSWACLLLVLFAGRGVVSAGWSAVRQVSALEGEAQLTPRLRLVGREQELRHLLPHLIGVRRVGYLSWKPSVYRVQYSIAPTIAVLNDTRLPMLLVELDGAQRLQFPAESWQELARTPRGQFVLLRRR